MALPVIENRKARHQFEILEKLEMGVVLRGTEIKSIRKGNLNLAEAYVVVRNSEAWMVNAYIDEYAQGNIFNHTPRRERKLLAHRRELNKLDQATSVKGLTLIPLKAYFKGDHLKVEVGVCRGKSTYDKRADKSKQEAKRDIDRALKDANRMRS
jgi:SsrA-binding protein